MNRFRSVALPKPKRKICSPPQKTPLFSVYAAVSLFSHLLFLYTTTTTTTVTLFHGNRFARSRETAVIYPPGALAAACM